MPIARTAPPQRKPQFIEVNAKRTSPAFQRYIDGALAELKKSNSPVAKHTLHAIESGAVRVDTLDDLTRADYLRVREEYMKDGTVMLPLHGDPHDPKSRAFRAIRKDLDGYMWDDRIYVTQGQGPKALAATLVHEVNHVLNKSEEHYRGDHQILTEEYRAFYVEALFQHDTSSLTPAQCRAIKKRVVDDYGLKHVTADDVDDVPPGILF